jgi:hypothetical protein
MDESGEPLGIRFRIIVQNREERGSRLTRGLVDRCAITEIRLIFDDLHLVGGAAPPDETSAAVIHRNDIKVAKCLSL